MTAPAHRLLTSLAPEAPSTGSSLTGECVATNDTTNPIVQDVALVVGGTPAEPSGAWRWGSKSSRRLRPLAARSTDAATHRAPTMPYMRSRDARGHRVEFRAVGPIGRVALHPVRRGGAAAGPRPLYTYPPRLKDQPDLLGGAAAR